MPRWVAVSRPLARRDDTGRLSSSQGRVMPATSICYSQPRRRHTPSSTRAVLPAIPEQGASACHRHHTYLTQASCTDVRQGCSVPARSRRAACQVYQAGGWCGEWLKDCQTIYCSPGPGIRSGGWVSAGRAMRFPKCCRHRFCLSCSRSAGCGVLVWHGVELANPGQAGGEIEWG